MCPLRCREISNVTADTRVNEWLSTSLCCVALFYQHRENSQIICDECYADSDPLSQNYYVSVSRHYVHIGHGELFETCQACDAVLPRNRISNDCLTCRIALTDFIEYLQFSRDRPYDCDEPTILMIAVTRNTRVGFV